MPLISANAANVWQHCAACGANNRIAINTIELGVSVGGRTDPNAILLPACDCGAREVLVRTWDTCASSAQGTHLDVHRKAVNSLAKKLKDTGRSHANAAATHAAEVTSPPDVVTFPFNAVSAPHGAPPSKAGRS